MSTSRSFRFSSSAARQRRRTMRSPSTLAALSLWFCCLSPPHAEGSSFRRAVPVARRTVSSLKKHNMSSSPVILAATAKHTATIIFLHGLGDTGHGWASGIGAIKPPFAKVICPTAPTMPVTLNSGFKMPSWFDLKSLDASANEDEEGILKAAEGIHKLIQAEENAGIRSDRILLGGFSQGGALALYSAFTYPRPLGGVMALSCWLPLHKKFPGYAVGNKNTPILQCHGDCDPLVPYKWGQMTASIIKQYATNVDFKTYRGCGHSSTEEEMVDMKDFAAQCLRSE